MPNPPIINKAEEAVKEGVKTVSEAAKKEATGVVREAFAQMLGIPLPDSHVNQIKQQDKAATNTQIGEVEKQLAEMQQSQSPKPTEMKNNPAVKQQQAQAQMAQDLHREAQALGQTNENQEERERIQKERAEEQQKLQEEQDKRDNLAQPMGLPGSPNQSPMSKPVKNRASTGETLKKRDT